MNPMLGNDLLMENSENKDSQSLKGKHIVLGITGGIAAYKAVYLLRLLIKEGAEVQVILTKAAKEFIQPVTLSSLSGKPVISEFFTANTGEWHSHVDIGLWSDLMLIAPATANTIAKMTCGIADNMLLTTYLSSKSPVMIAPAMDLDMWKHPATQRNISQILKDGVTIVEPEEGMLASGLTGKGRMAEPETILKSVKSYFSNVNSLQGKKVLVTAGPTYEKIDPVRFIGNFSSGKMGFAIAEEFSERGADVTLISGPVNISTKNPKIKRINIVSAQQMYEAAISIFDKVDYAVLVAAVADYSPKEISENKIKREGKTELTLSLKSNPDIAAALGERKKKQILVGFALETDNERFNAQKKLERKNLDWIVMNSMRNEGTCFMTDSNQIKMFSATGDELDFPIKDKREVAKDIIDVITNFQKINK